jgi:hypothetical protein
VVEALPNWTSHFRRPQAILGHPPNARPFGRVVRFSPKSPEEYRAVQKYLMKAEKADHAITWYCYSPPSELPTKVAIRDLPADTPHQAIQEALEDQGFTVSLIRGINPGRNRPGCLFHIQLDHLEEHELRRLYNIDTLLYMPGITIEAWRPHRGPAQCHRCQAVTPQ